MNNILSTSSKSNTKSSFDIDREKELSDRLYKSKICTCTTLRKKIFGLVLFSFVCIILFSRSIWRNAIETTETIANETTETIAEGQANRPPNITNEHRTCSTECQAGHGSRIELAKQESNCFICLQPAPLYWSGTPPPTSRVGTLDLNGISSSTKDGLRIKKRLLPVNLISQKCKSPPGPVPGLRQKKVKQCWEDGWLKLDNNKEPKLITFDDQKAQKCLANKHIVFVGNSITRYMAWALMDLVSNYQFRKQFPDVTPQYWGSHAQYFTKFWSLQEANQGEHKKDAIKMWQYRTPTNNSPSDPDGRQDSGYWMSSINLNVTFGHVLEFEDGPGEYPGTPWDVVERSKKMYGRTEDPSLIIYSMGLRSLTSTSYSTYPKNVLSSMNTLQKKNPNSAILYQLVGASFDNPRQVDFVPQMEKSITEHNIAVLKELDGSDFAAFSINELQAQEENAQATLDGIHFLEGTGVNEALIQVLLNRIC